MLTQAIVNDDISNMQAQFSASSNSINEYIKCWKDFEQIGKSSKLANKAKSDLNKLTQSLWPLVHKSKKLFDDMIVLLCNIDNIVMRKNIGDNILIDIDIDNNDDVKEVVSLIKKFSEEIKKADLARKWVKIRQSAAAIEGQLDSVILSAQEELEVSTKLKSTIKNLKLFTLTVGDKWKLAVMPSFGTCAVIVGGLILGGVIALSNPIGWVCLTIGALALTCGAGLATPAILAYGIRKPWFQNLFKSLINKNEENIQENQAFASSTKNPVSELKKKASNIANIGFSGILTGAELKERIKYCLAFAANCHRELENLLNAIDNN